MCLRKEGGLSAGILPSNFMYQHSTGCCLKTVCVYSLSLCLWDFAGKRLFPRAIMFTIYPGSYLLSEHLGQKLKHGDKWVGRWVDW